MSTLSLTQLENLRHASASSVACERATRLPAELTVSQWALESGWGAHQPGNNCFGIKAYQGCFGRQALDTIEVIGGVRKAVLKEFATFASLDDCFRKHAAIFTSEGRYARAWSSFLQSSNVEAFIREVAPVYATDPSYAATLLRIVGMPPVANALRQARTSSNRTD